MFRGPAAKVGSIPTTTIRLYPVDIELARKLAEKRGLKYQTYLKMLIHEALLAKLRLLSHGTTTAPVAYTSTKGSHPL